MKLRFHAWLLLPLLLMFDSARAQVPTDSIYRLPITLTDQDGGSFHLEDRAGKVQLVSMFYTSCQLTCPLVIEAIKRNQATLDAGARAKLDVLVVSFDAQHDTTQRLEQVFVERKIDAKTWTFARADARDVRKLAAALDIQYRVLDNGMINHSTALVLLDAQVRILARTDALSSLDPEFVKALQSALAAR